ncbi:phosphoenolpyruvate carboxylase [Mycolicibacterium setense]|nr:phosphoenolpyruvate carboxylase [Mycolicibacterium setense]
MSLRSRAPHRARAPRRRRPRRRRDALARTDVASHAGVAQAFVTRADARRSRAPVLDAARRTFADEGVDAFPYLETLNHLQVELLRRYRAGDTDELVQRGTLLTMSGLATALRNSG